MRKTLKQTANAILKPLGLELCRRNDHTLPAREDTWLTEQYRALINEIHGCFCEIVFPELPHCNRRVELLEKLLGTPVSEAMCIVKYLHNSLHLDGDVCEFGVAQGATSALLANEIRETKKSLWLFDSFKGLGKPGEKDMLINDIFNLGSIEKYEGTMACRLDEVESRLMYISFPFSRVKIVAGFIEETIKSAALPEKVCFAYVDFDFYSPILTALRFLHRHLSVGGSVVVDDYGFFSSGAKSAVDEFLAEHGDNYKIIFPYHFAALSTPFCILYKKA